jgi:hypothetical protein
MPSSVWVRAVRLVFHVADVCRRLSAERKFFMLQAAIACRTKLAHLRKSIDHVISVGSTLPRARAESPARRARPADRASWKQPPSAWLVRPPGVASRNGVLVEDGGQGLQLRLEKPGNVTAYYLARNKFPLARIML